MSNHDLQIATIVSYPFEENTYIAHLAGRDDCLVFDPGLEPAKIIEYLQEGGLTPAAILCTHGHSDHIGGNAALKEKWPDCPLLIGAADASKLTEPRENLSGQFGQPMTSPPADRLLEEGDTFSGAGIDLEVLSTPGHSIGHVVFVFRQISPIHVIGGDVLFEGSVGRTDFPDGDFSQLQEAIHAKLFTMPDNTIVMPGHGRPTTIGHEKQTNPFVALPADIRKGSEGNRTDTIVSEIKSP